MSKKKRYYTIEFTRFGSDLNFIEEKVVVILETPLFYPYGDIDEFVNQAFRALWKQYPVWKCPFNSSNPAKTKFDKLRYGWSSPSMRKITEI